MWKTQPHGPGDTGTKSKEVERMLIDRGPFRRAVLKQYCSQMSKANTRPVFDDFTAEILSQQGFSWEEDPRSIYDPQQLYTALNRYATQWTANEGLDSSLEFGFRKAYKIFARPKAWKQLQVLSDSEVQTKALKLAKSAGLPTMKSKRDSLTYAFDREKQIRLGIKAPNPCVAYKRTQKGNKTRLVWGYPLEMTIMESRFARPLIQRMLWMETPMAFGMMKITMGAKIHRYCVEGKGTTVCLDYSKYDTTLSKTMIKQAFRILSTWFSDEDRVEFGWDTVVGYFIGTPIVMPDGHLYTGKDHGVPSGSYFTQMIDSIVNVALCYALSHKFKFKIAHDSLYVLGDDVIMNVVGEVNLGKWGEYLTSKYGLLLHGEEKTEVGRAHFLGAYWDKGKPDVPIQELVNKATFPENFRDYGGQPHSGAEGVLASYASNYLCAHQFLPTGLRLQPRVRDLSFAPDFRFLTGSDKYLYETEKLLGHKTSVGPTSLTVRILS
jgi:hypothetical protein